jgi:hypothetical protein
MPNLIREERYICQIQTEEHILRVQELISGSEPWPKRFRVCLPASRTREAKTIYGETARQVADLATDYFNVSLKLAKIPSHVACD